MNKQKNMKKIAFYTAWLEAPKAKETLNSYLQLPTLETEEQQMLTCSFFPLQQTVGHHLVVIQGETCHCGCTEAPCGDGPGDNA